MKSFQTLYTDVQNQTGDDSSDFLTQIKRWINETQTTVLGSGPWKFLEKTGTITTEADTGTYPYLGDMRKAIAVTVTPDGGTTVYRPDPVDDPDRWEYLNSLQQSPSDITQYWYQEGNNLLLWPDYDTAGHTITVRYRKRVIEMSRADYTTGTIVTATLGSKAIVGGSTSWTGRKPVGEQWIRLDMTDGDYQWYKITTITDATNIVLESKYQGVSIAAGSETYTIGEFPSLPREFHDLCFYRPMALAYARLENISMSNFYWNLYDGGYEAGNSRREGGMLKKMRKEQAGSTDSGFYPSRGVSGPESPEELARDTISTLG